MQRLIRQLVFGKFWKVLKASKQKINMIQTTVLKDHSGIGGGKRFYGTQYWKDGNQATDYSYSPR